MKDLKDIKVGIIYIVNNIHTKKNYFKVGFTTRTVHERFADSWNKSSPSAFSLERGSGSIAIYAVLEPKKIETEIHNALVKYRVKEEREWFEIDLDKLKEIIEQIINKSKDNTSREINLTIDNNNIENNKNHKRQEGGKTFKFLGLILLLIGIGGLPFGAFGGLSIFFIIIGVILYYTFR